MEVSSLGSIEANVKLQKASESQLEKVTKTILSGIDQSVNDNREYFNTGHRLNVTA